MYPSFWFCTLQFDIMKVVFASALVLASADFAEFKARSGKVYNSYDVEAHHEANYNSNMQQLLR